MRLKIPPDQTKALRSKLIRAGTNEIGGQLFGEQLAPSHFRATEVTFQKRPGTFARFLVDLVQASRDAISFFERTNRQYTRFNYIGEWHSHPSFEVEPSTTDINTMLSLVEDAGFQGSFAVLMIVRLKGEELICKAWLFDATSGVQNIELEFEE